MSASLFSLPTDKSVEASLEKLDSRMSRLIRAMRTSGRWSGIALFTLALLIVLLWHRVIYIVPAGGGGVMYSLFFGGTVTDYVFGEGIHIMLPFDRFTIYDTRVQVVESQFTTLTNKGLPIDLKLVIRYHPEYDTLALLDQRVGQDYVSKIVKPQVESVLRRYIGREEPEAIYTNKEGVLSSIISRAIEETSEQLVSIDDIIIREVSLPVPLRDAIATKLTYQQDAEAYEFRLMAEQREADRKRIEAEGISAAQKIINATLTQDLLRYESIRVEGEVAKSNNAKIIFMNGRDAPQVNLNVP